MTVYENLPNWITVQVASPVVVVRWAGNLLFLSFVFIRILKDATLLHSNRERLQITQGKSLLWQVLEVLPACACSNVLGGNVIFC